MTNYPKGSMGAAEAKSEKRFLAGLTFVYLLLFAFVFFNLFHTNFHIYEKATEGWLKVIGLVFYFAGLVGSWFFVAKQDEINNAQSYWKICAAAPFVGLGLCMLGGM